METGLFFILLDLIAISPLLAGYSSLKHLRWWRSLGPSRMLKHLFISSMMTFVASIPLSAIALYRLILGPTAPPFPNAVLWIGGTILLLVGTSMYRAIVFRDLDHAADEIQAANGSLTDGDVIADTYEKKDATSRK